MIYFTSDWHLNDDRLSCSNNNILNRFFDSVDEHNNYIINTFKEYFTDGDTLYYVGDLVYNYDDNIIQTLTDLKLNYPKSTFNLVLGNYDVDHVDKLSDIFDNIYENVTIVYNDVNINLNHYPSNISTNNDINLVGHIHGLWRIQKNMINVGIDAWHYVPVSFDKVIQTWNAIKDVFVNDKDVFPNNNHNK